MLYGSLGCNKRGVGWNGCGGVVVSVVWGVAGGGELCLGEPHLLTVFTAGV